MTNFQLSAIDLERKIRESNYFVRLFDECLGGRNFADMKDNQIHDILSDFWESLPDEISIQKAPFFILCDMLAMDDMSNEALALTLESKVREVTFTKVNGEIRVMRATRNEQIIRKALGDETIVLEPVDEEQNSIIVFDVEINEWRRIRPLSIIEII